MRHLQGISGRAGGVHAVLSWIPLLGWIVHRTANHRPVFHQPNQHSATLSTLTREREAVLLHMQMLFPSNMVHENRLLPTRDAVNLTVFCTHTVIALTSFVEWPGHAFSVDHHEGDLFLLKEQSRGHEK